MESQFSIQQSCLKSKQKNDKSCYTNFKHKKANKEVQTEDYLDVLSGRSFNLEECRSKLPRTVRYLGDLSKNNQNLVNLVDYDINSDDSEAASDNGGEVRLPSAFNFPPSPISSKDNSVICKIENDAIFQYRQDHIVCDQPKIYENSSSKRKNMVPKKIDSCLMEIVEIEDDVKQEKQAHSIDGSENESNDVYKNQV